MTILITTGVFGGNGGLLVMMLLSTIYTCTAIALERRGGSFDMGLFGGYHILLMALLGLLSQIPFRRFTTRVNQLVSTNNLLSFCKVARRSPSYAYVMLLVASAMQCI